MDNKNCNPKLNLSVSLAVKFNLENDRPGKKLKGTLKVLLCALLGGLAVPGSTPLPKSEHKAFTKLDCPLLTETLKTGSKHAMVCGMNLARLPP